MYQIDPIEVNQLRDIFETVRALREYLMSGNEVHPGSLLHDDDEPIEVHLTDNMAALGDIIVKAQGEI